MQTIRVKKSAMNAEGIYDYNKIQFSKEGFLSCEIKEEKENLNIQYHTGDMLPCTEIRNFSKQDRIRVLLDVAGKFGYRKEYCFSLSPDNLYFDRNFRVYIMQRDIWARGEEPGRESEEERFLQEYKALIGYALQKKYCFEDYTEGGLELLEKKPFLKKIYHAETIEGVTELLTEEFETITRDIRENKILVKKSNWRQRTIYIVASMILLVAAGAYIGYYSLWERPLMTSKLEAENAYLRGDSIKVIDALSGISMAQLEYEQKHILSNAYVSMESLTAEQKENILARLSVNGDVKLMEYWIYIGRLNAIEAENIAMQLSDDELLLYAYMLEKDLTESDTTMTGEEKAAKLKELEGKIDDLAEPYMTEEEEN